MAYNKKKVKGVLSKTLAGARKGYKEASRAIVKYGPGIQKGLGSVAQNIQEGFSATPRMIKRNGKMILHKPKSRQDEMYMQISKKGKSRMVSMPKMKKKKVDWANLGVRY